MPVTAPFMTTIAPLVIAVMIAVVTTMVIPLVVALAITTFPAINIKEIVPGKSPIPPQRRMPVPLAKRLIAFQPAWHVL